MKKVTLKKPVIDREQIVGVNVGFRPYRKGGIRIEEEIISGKQVIHNYGYGGSGLTLCWGGASLVNPLIRAKPKPNGTIAVLGGGVVGLAMAYTLLEQGFRVNIYADEWSPHLASNVAAGIWTAPSTWETEDEKNRLKLMLEASRKRYEANEFAGIRKLDYFAFNTDPNIPLLEQYHEEKVSVHFENGGTKEGLRYHDFALDGKLFIEDLMKKVTRKATCIQRSFYDAKDVATLDEECIINCTSYGSKKIFGDDNLYLIRGHLIYLPKQEVHYKIYQPISSDYFLSIYPWHDRLIVGGVYEHDQKDKQVDPQVVDQMLSHANNFFTGIA